MPVHIGWDDVALRLALAILSGALLGLNRAERGMAAGLRTTLLVTLAAAVSMIQVNLLLGTDGRPSDSIVMLDLMRLPLGVLTGMGFIGAGAILRRGDRVSGVTTAATLWLATMIGLCFGGGQHVLGITALVVGVFILWTLKRLETKLPQDRHGTLSLTMNEDGPSSEDVRSVLESAGGQITLWDVAISRKGSTSRRKIQCEVHWPGCKGTLAIPGCVQSLLERKGVTSVRWRG